MEFWWFMFIFSLLIPAVIIVSGRAMWKHCPKNINYLVGYRTKRSMTNTDTWRFAHDYCGRLWWKLGWVMLILSAIVMMPFFRSTENVIGIIGIILITAQCVALIIPVITTEKALKNTFSDDGTRK